MEHEVGLCVPQGFGTLHCNGGFQGEEDQAAQSMLEHEEGCLLQWFGHYDGTSFPRGLRRRLAGSSKAQECGHCAAMAPSQTWKGQGLHRQARAALGHMNGLSPRDLTGQLCASDMSVSFPTSCRQPCVACAAPSNQAAGMGICTVEAH